MKSSSGAQPNPDAARQAAEATAAGREPAGRHAAATRFGQGGFAGPRSGASQRRRARAGRAIDKLAAQQQNSDPSDLTDTMARMRERDRLAQDRQQLSDDLSKLEKNIRDSAREMAPNQPGVAKQLRDALTEMDNADLDNHTQRTADWLRRGINPNSNGTEARLPRGSNKLKEQLQQAQQAMNDSSRGQRGPGREAGQADQTAALDTIERLRNQIESMTRERERSGQPGSAGSAEWAARRSAAREQQWPQFRSQQRGAGRARQSASESRRRRQAGSQPDDRSGSAAEPVRRCGRTGGRHSQRRRTRRRWHRVGQHQHRQQSVRSRAQHARPMILPAITLTPSERSSRRLRELNQLRQMVKGDPEAAKEAEELARQMQHLDPRRFPGNPAIVEQMHHEVLSSIDRLELAVGAQRGGHARIAHRKAAGRAGGLPGFGG